MNRRAGLLRHDLEWRCASEGTQINPHFQRHSRSAQIYSETKTQVRSMCRRLRNPIIPAPHKKDALLNPPGFPKSFIIIPSAKFQPAFNNQFANNTALACTKNSSSFLLNYATNKNVMLSNCKCSTIFLI